MTIAGVVLSSLLAGLFLILGASKLVGARVQVENFKLFRLPQWFRLVTGATEVAGAVGLLIGIWVDEAAIVAGVWLGMEMLGASAVHVFRERKPTKAIATVTLLGLAVAVSTIAASQSSLFS